MCPLIHGVHTAKNSNSLLFVKSTWELIFDGDQEKTTNLTDHFNVSGNIWVYDCTFNVYNFNGPGAAICKHPGTSYNLLVDFLFFMTATQHNMMVAPFILMKANVFFLLFAE